eukprot:9815341-Lingulodinium_polyedra.AAC.1
MVAGSILGRPEGGRSIHVFVSARVLVAGATPLVRRPRCPRSGWPVRGQRWRAGLLFCRSRPRKFAAQQVAR